MRLLPDLRVYTSRLYGYVFTPYMISLQDPYTIDNELIVNVWLDQNIIKIRTIELDNSYFIGHEYLFDIHILNQKIESIYRDVLSGSTYCDEHSRQVNIPFNFNMYFNKS